MSETVTMTLTSFLLARFAEDEAEFAVSDAERADPSLYGGDLNEGYLVGLRLRLLADLEAKRRIVDWAAPVLTNWPNAPEGFRYVSNDGLDLLRILASVYADHPEFRQEWAP